MKDSSRHNSLQTAADTNSLNQGCTNYCDSAGSVFSDEATKHPLPYDLSHVKKIIAEPWITVSNGESDFLEGPVCDKNGNLILCHRFIQDRTMISRILKVDTEGNISVLFESDSGILLNGLALHKDGRIFAADVLGSILSFDENGKELTQIPAECDGKKIMPNDLVFGKNGDLYVTDFTGNAVSPTGGVYRITSESEYTTIVPFQENMCTGNGIAFAPDFGCIWVAETALNRIDRIRVNTDGTNRGSFLDPCVVYQGIGIAGPDGTRTDECGNIYQVFNPGGYAAVLNSSAIPVAVIVLSDREKGDGLTTTSLAINYADKTGYFLSCGSRGTVIYKFTALAPAAPSFYTLTSE